MSAAATTSGGRVRLHAPGRGEGHGPARSCPRTAERDRQGRASQGPACARACACAHLRGHACSPRAVRVCGVRTRVPSVRAAPCTRVLARCVLLRVRVRVRVRILCVFMRVRVQHAAELTSVEAVGHECQAGDTGFLPVRCPHPPRWGGRAPAGLRRGHRRAKAHAEAKVTAVCEPQAGRCHLPGVAEGVRDPGRGFAAPTSFLAWTPQQRSSQVWGARGCCSHARRGPRLGLLPDRRAP